MSQAFKSDVARHIETADKVKKFVARHNFHVALEATLYHDFKTSECCNRCIFSLTTCEVLRYAALFFCTCRYIMKYLFHDMNTYVLLHFEDRNDVTIIIKLQRATYLRLVALYKSLIMIATSFLCSKYNGA